MEDDLKKKEKKEDDIKKTFLKSSLMKGQTFLGLAQLSKILFIFLHGTRGQK
jgi:hypothetical protein